MANKTINSSSIIFFIMNKTKFLSNNTKSSTIAYFLTLNDIFLEMEIEQQEDQIVVRKSDKYFLFKPILLKEIDLPYYMLVLKKQNPFDIYFINKDFTAFVNIFKDIIKS